MGEIFKYELGDEVKDSITNFVGVIVARTQWLNGCIRYGVQARKIGTDGKEIMLTIDEPQLILVKAKNAAPKSKPGGPHPVIMRQSTPPRR